MKRERYVDVASPDECSDTTVNQWVYVVLPLLASGAAIGIAWIDPTQSSLGPARYVGLAGIGAGIGLVAWTVLAYSRVGEILSPVVGPEHLVTSGPLAWTRNPMYLGVLMTVTGVVVAAASPVGAVYTGLMGLVYHALVVLVEEPKLESAFGDIYRDYCDQVRNGSRAALSDRPRHVCFRRSVSVCYALCG